MHSRTHFYGMGINVILPIPLFYTYIFLCLELNLNFTILYNIYYLTLKVSCLILSLHHYNMCEKCIANILMISCSSST